MIEPSSAAITVGEPGICSILEFDDGKIMMPYLENLLHCDWNQIKTVLDKSAEAKHIFDGVQIAAWGYWSNIPDFDNILRNLVHSYLGSVNRMFFDFANINKKSVNALKETLNIMRELNTGIPMTLSLNEHEGELMLKYYDAEDLQTLQSKIGIDEIIIHTPAEALIATANEGFTSVAQDYVDNPIRTSGAGDAFNGGYIAASLGNLDVESRLRVANASTNFYLKHAMPPTIAQLSEYFEKDGVHAC